jgi:N-dimethylarginine dimethylaminohydrolase
MAGLDWGRRFLVCPPTYFGVLYEINPWMHKSVQVDPDKAKEQWNNLVNTFKEAGAEIEIQAPVDGWPDMVFTANAGIVNGNQFVPTHFRHIERQGETRYDIDWFVQNGYMVERLPDTVVQEGAGDALPFGPADRRVLVAGHRTRSDAASHAYLSAVTGAAMASVELVDERLYHLDLTFTPISDRRALIAPMAFNKQGNALLNRLVPDAFLLEDDEALSFCCNSVVIGDNIVMPNCPPRVGRQLEAWGLNVVVCDVSEFMKGGGGCRCLSLALDVTVAFV